MLSAHGLFVLLLDFFSMNSDLLEGAERIATETRLESPTFVALSPSSVVSTHHHCGEAASKRACQPATFVRERCASGPKARRSCPSTSFCRKRAAHNTLLTGPPHGDLLDRNTLYLSADCHPVRSSSHEYIRSGRRSVSGQVYAVRGVVSVPTIVRVFRSAERLQTCEQLGASHTTGGVMLNVGQCDH